MSTVSGLANVSASKRAKSKQLHSPFSHSEQWSHGYTNSMTAISPKLSFVACQPTVGQSPGCISSFFTAFQQKAAKTNSKHKHTSSPLETTPKGRSPQSQRLPLYLSIITMSKMSMCPVRHSGLSQPCLLSGLKQPSIFHTVAFLPFLAAHALSHNKSKFYLFCQEWPTPSPELG